MSILIKGMKMPTDCIFCPMFYGAWAMCNVLSKTTSAKGRPDECPLVEIPTHGRLIDADALMKSDRMVGKLMMYGGEYVYTQAEIDRAPTIIPASEEGEDG